MEIQRQQQRPSVRQRESWAKRILALEVAAIVCFLVVLTTLPAMAGTTGTGERNEFGDATFATVQDSGAPARYESKPRTSDKLTGAAEWTDDSGIVHGRAENGIEYVLYGRGQVGAESDKISFAAVGDVFATSMNFPILDAYAGSVGDGEYDFAPYYQAVSGDIGAHDLSFVNQETPCAGTDGGREYSGYPVFNTPDPSVSAIAQVGFSVANFNSNHSWDQGEYGIARTQELFARHPEVMLIGSYESDYAREAVHLVERNGARIAFLSYAYGDNMYGANPDNFPNQYYSCEFDRDRMRAEVERARSVADAVVVYMHWGTEYIAQPDDQQVEYAQFLADLDVDLVIGSHAHILQPVKYYTSASGKQVPVVFGLSDFITGWTITDTIISGMFSCDFAWDGDALAVRDCSFTPAIEWSDGGDTYVRFVKDMTADEIAANTRTPDVADDNAYLHEFVDALGMDVPVIW